MLTKEECSNSGGWFKDPFTGEDISPDYPRALTCKPGEKWVQPAVMFQDGNIVKISGRCWNEDEKACYKEYRGKPVSSKTREPKAVKAKPKAKLFVETPLDEREVISFNSESACSAETLAIIYMCDKLLGISQIDGITYALLTSKDSNIIYHVPRAVIKNEQFERLCNGGAA